MIKAIEPIHEKQVYALICELQNSTLDTEKFQAIFALQGQIEGFFRVGYFENEQLVGYMSLRIEWHLHHVARIMEIQELVVQTQFRGKGIGGKLLTHAKEVAEELGVYQIELSSNRLRVDAHRFYAREGFLCNHFKFSYLITP
jgi:PhnO protein